ncbi:hypothetical protein [Arcobacter sp.]|uniref:hypothetical protein n=1 Tax=unclassified Arcobacter TaxID=2593671 RepID=UPI003B002730
MIKIRIKEFTQSFFLVFIIWIFFDHFYIQPSINENRELFDSWDNFIKNLGMNYLHIFVMSWILFWYIFVKDNQKILKKYSKKEDKENDNNNLK